MLAWPDCSYLHAIVKLLVKTTVKRSRGVPKPLFLGHTYKHIYIFTDALQKDIEEEEISR
jgi:hypothetical protein